MKACSGAPSRKEHERHRGQGLVLPFPSVGDVESPSSCISTRKERYLGRNGHLYGSGHPQQCLLQLDGSLVLGGGGVLKVGTLFPFMLADGRCESLLSIGFFLLRERRGAPLQPMSS